MLPKCCFFGVQNCTLNYSRGSLSAFCLEPGCSPDCSRASISCITRSKLALCVVHCGHTVAKAASYEVNEGTNSDFNAYEMPKPWTHSFSVGQLTHSPMHRHMYTATYRTVRDGWRVGIVKSIVIVTATAAPRSDLTLPYLTYLPTYYLPIST